MNHVIFSITLLNILKLKDKYFLMNSKIKKNFSDIRVEWGSVNNRRGKQAGPKFSTPSSTQKQSIPKVCRMGDPTISCSSNLSF